MGKAVLFAAMFGFGVCCGSGGSYGFSIQAPGALRFEPGWSGRTESPAAVFGVDYTLIRVRLPRGSALPAREKIEVFRGAEPLDLRGVLQPLLEEDGSCPFAAVDYDVSGLAPGEYTVVHRASTAPPGLTTTETRWTEHEGERALVTILEIQTTRPAAGRDGGTE